MLGGFTAAPGCFVVAWPGSGWARGGVVLSFVCKSRFMCLHF